MCDAVRMPIDGALVCFTLDCLRDVQVYVYPVLLRVCLNTIVLAQPRRIALLMLLVLLRLKRASRILGASQIGRDMRFRLEFALGHVHDILVFSRARLRGRIIEELVLTFLCRAWLLDEHRAIRI